MIMSRNAALRAAGDHPDVLVFATEVESEGLRFFVDKMNEGVVQAGLV